MLRKIIVTAAALLASGFAASAADALRPAVVPTLVAKPTLQGWVGARYGALWGTSSGVRLLDEKTAAVNTPLARANFELEGRGAGFFLSGSSTAAAMGGGHLYVRNSANAFGGFGGFEVIPSTSTGYVFVGGEAKAFQGRLVWFGQASEAFAVDSGASNVWWVRVGVQAFHTDNFMWEGNLRYLGGGMTSWLASGSVEFRRPGHAWAWHGTVNYQTNVGSGGGAATSVLAGVKVHLGNSTLYQAYTTGAVWNLLPIAY
jgi:hypothetical protein